MLNQETISAIEKAGITKQLAVVIDSKLTKIKYVMADIQERGIVHNETMENVKLLLLDINQLVKLMGEVNNKKN